MNQPPFDPNSLADELDRLFAQGQASPSAVSNDPLIETAARLSAAPRPSLSPEAATKVHTVVLAAAASQRSAPSRLRRLRPSSPAQLLIAAILLVLLAASVAFAAQITIYVLNPLKATSTSIPTATSTATTNSPVNVAPALVPTAMLTSTATPSPTPIPASTNSVTSSPLPTSTSTLMPPMAASTAAQPTAIDIATTPTEATSTVTPESTSEPTLPVTLVIEGPIQSINSNILVIFKLTVVLDPNDPILKVLQVGEVVHVEGNIGGDMQVVTAVHVTTVTVETDVNPSNGQVWQDNGTCSNPPPPWAVAKGWRARCQGAPSSNSSGNSQGMGMGMGN